MILTDKLISKGLIHSPSWMKSNVHYLTITGSVAYGCSNDSSDQDIYGWCIPPKELIFPHLAGEINGFGNQIKRFDVYQQHHIVDKEEDKEYDISIYNIVKYFQLAMENNPNVIDTLFTPRRCILHCSHIAERVRENRHIFLHKGSYFKHKGYSYSQMHKMRIKNPDPSSKRYNGVIAMGYDTKYALHLVRLLLNAEMILNEHDLEIDRHREQLKSIRRGEWTLEQIEQFFYDKEKQLEEVYNKSTLRHSPDEQQIKKLLLECLEMHYGSLDKVISFQDKYEVALRQITEICERLNNVNIS